MAQAMGAAMLQPREGPRVMAAAYDIVAMLKAAPLPIGHILAQLIVDGPPVVVAHSAAVLLQSHVQHGEIFKSVSPLKAI